jgi:hypothetical protein
MAVLVIERDQVERTSSPVFGAEEGNGVSDGAVVDGILAGWAKKCGQAFDEVARDGHMPVAAFVVCRRR